VTADGPAESSADFGGDRGAFAPRSRTRGVRSGSRSRGRPPPPVTCRSLAFPTAHLVIRRRRRPPRGLSCRGALRNRQTPKHRLSRCVTFGARAEVAGRSPRHRCRGSRPSSPGSSVLRSGPLSRVSPAASGPTCGPYVPSVARGLAPCRHAREQTPFSAGFGREAARPLRSFRPRGSVPPRRLAPLPASDMLQSVPGLGFTRLAPGRPSALDACSEEPAASAVGSGPGGPSCSSLRRFESRSVSGPRHRGCRSPPAVPPPSAPRLLSSRRSRSGSIALPSARPVHRSPGGFEVRPARWLPSAGGACPPVPVCSRISA